MTKYPTASLVAMCFLSAALHACPGAAQGRYESLNDDALREILKPQNPNIGQERGRTILIEDKRLIIRKITQEYVSIKRVKSIVFGGLKFSSGSSVLSKEDYKALNRLGRLIKQILKSSPDELFLIEGHTDYPGGAMFNYRLSNKRALAVAGFLIENVGVPEKSLLAHGFGRDRMLVLTKKSERINRRVEIRNITEFVSVIESPRVRPLN